MKTRKLVWMILLSALLVLPLVLVMVNTQKNPDPPKKPPIEQNGDSGNKGDQSKEKPDSPIVWGVDSASKVDESFFQCVDKNYGKPAVFGRYLETKEGISTGMSKKEASFLHKKGVKIIPIYNHVTDATTYKKGVLMAKDAIAFAKREGIPKGVAIFADIEPSYPVDEGFIRGWVDTLVKSPYKPGIYGVFTKEKKLTSAYQKGLTKDKNVQSQTVIWSSNPDPGIQKKKDAPKFHPKAPEDVKVSIWQYGIDGKACNIDTDLIQSEVLNYLW